MLKYDMIETYNIVTAILKFQQNVNGMDEKEFIRVRDFAIHKLFPERFSDLPKNFVCAQCGRVENVVDAFVRQANDLNEPRWLFREVLDPTYEYSRDSIGGCSDGCYNLIEKRLKSYETIS